ncbi:Basic endochitinase [Acorus gramineus]|uniref:chitinase n=1 Tax=Acorus gramineus TaxID=55184 RepID=A0AAV9B8B3_ACOGR|nr:Basic endochitinase [Acorus gramineus]
MRTHTMRIVVFLLLTTLVANAQTQCGKQNGGALCPGDLCCSQWGYCGTTDDYCGTGCQSQCGGGDDGDDDGDGGAVGSLISRSLFEEMLKHRNDVACLARGFYTYDDFVASANSFDGFATTGDEDTRKREIAAFLAQTSHETTGGWETAPDGPYAWGYCFKEEINPASDYCVPSVEYPCVPGQKYYGRGPIQISYNYNYGQAGKYLGIDLLSNPGLVVANGSISFDTAFWFWMTTQLPKPSCHDVMTGKWKPSNADVAAGRLEGFGLTTNIINGGVECGTGPNMFTNNRIGFYKRYCDLLGVSYGDNLDCDNMRPYSLILEAVQDMK